MSNYTDANLITTTAIDKARAIKIGNKILTGFCESTPKIYKCASVASGTWTGYLYDAATQIFASTATTGLTYTYNAPTTGKIYTQDALLEISPAYLGLPSVYFPLNGDAVAAIGGMTATEIGTCTYVTDSGVRCVSVDTSSGLWANYNTNISTPFSFSFFSKIETGVLIDTLFHFGKRVDSSNVYDYYQMSLQSDGYKLSDGEAWISFGETNNGQWTHIAVTYDGSNVVVYYNGIRKVTRTRTFPNRSVSKFSFAGCSYIDDCSSPVCDNPMKMAELKLYSRCLNQAEITAEYNRLHAMVTE